MKGMYKNASARHTLLLQLVLRLIAFVLKLSDILSKDTVALLQVVLQCTYGESYQLNMETRLE